MKKLLFVVLAWFAIAGVAFAAINVNTATKEELMTLNGIGDVKAKAIIDYRTKNGPFKSVDEVDKVPGIGEGILGKIKNDITLTGKTTVAAPVAKAGKAADKKDAKKADAKGAKAEDKSMSKADKAPSDKVAKEKAPKEKAPKEKAPKEKAPAEKSAKGDDKKAPVGKKTTGDEDKKAAAEKKTDDKKDAKKY